MRKFLNTVKDINKIAIKPATKALKPAIDAGSKILIAPLKMGANLAGGTVNVSKSLATGATGLSQNLSGFVSSPIFLYVAIGVGGLIIYGVVSNKLK